MTPVSPPMPVPELQCDIVMKGGVTSGVVYPGALCELGRSYRFRQLGGASAGAIGAAMAAAAEYGRAVGISAGDGSARPGASPDGDTGSGPHTVGLDPPAADEPTAAADAPPAGPAPGTATGRRPASSFEALALMPAELGGGRLRQLFQPDRRTAGWLRLLLAATGRTPWPAPVAALVVSWPVPAILGLLPGLVVAGYTAIRLGGSNRLAMAVGAAVLVVALVVAVAGALAAAAWGAYRSLTKDVVANHFGICSGLATGKGEGPGLTDWLTARVNTVAGLSAGGHPLTFGQLWECPGVPKLPGQRSIDLRMITTCLSEGRPYEMPWEQKRFFYSVEEWSRLFPTSVMTHLLAHEPSPITIDEGAARAAHQPPLHRLPEPADLPVIVATRMSLSFPLLISAVPMWAEDWRRSRPGRPVYERVWFTDGGFCSNFPVHLFDAALPTRPTFAISLDQFDHDEDEDPIDERRNIRYSRDNGPVPPRIVELPEAGVSALTGFFWAALNTSRNWTDTTNLFQPGFRDRIVKVLQTSIQGGMNLHMDSGTIDRLSSRGQAAAAAMVNQFTKPQYPAKLPEFTGWDNHRWVRFRALMSTLPAWSAGIARGGDGLPFTRATQPSYRTSEAQLDLTEEVMALLQATAHTFNVAASEAVRGLERAPNPRGTLRRVPDL